MDQNRPPSLLKPNAGGIVIPSSTPAAARNDADFIRKALIVLGLSIAFSAVLVGASRMFLNKLRDTGAQLQAQRDEVRNRYVMAETEKEEIRTYQPRFLKLRARGFFGHEKRLDLIEHIKRIHDARRLLPFNYEIAAQQPFQLEPTTLNADLELRSSKIMLQMELLHEMDLFHFLEDLKGKAFYTSQACEIKRAESVFNAPLTPRLNAECTLHWLSIGELVPDAPSTAEAK